MNRDEKADGIDTVTYTTESETKFNTEFVDKSTAEEAKDCKGGVESRVLPLSARVTWGNAKKCSPCCQPTWDQFYHRHRDLRGH